MTDCGSLEGDLWRVLWNHLHPNPLSLHFLPSCCLFYSDCSAPCWNGGFMFLVVWGIFGFLFCFGGLVLFAWIVWCFKLSVRWPCDTYVMIVPFCSPWHACCDKHYCLFCIKSYQMCKIIIFCSSFTDLTTLSSLCFRYLLHLIAFACWKSICRSRHFYMFLLKFLC